MAFLAEFGAFDLSLIFIQDKLNELGFGPNGMFVSWPVHRFTDLELNSIFIKRFHGKDASEASFKNDLCFQFLIIRIVLTYVRRNSADTNFVTGNNFVVIFIGPFLDRISLASAL
jgi:hypothetical protein